MNQRIFVLLCVLALVSCTIDTDSATSKVADSQIAVSTKSSKTIKEYRVFNCADESVYLRYHFSDTGLLNQIDLEYWDQKILINYDGLSQILNLTKVDAAGTVLVSKDLIYDTDGHLVSLGGRTFDFIEDKKMYFEDIILAYDSDAWDDIVYVENRYEQYEVTPGNPIPQYCEYFEQVYTNTTTGKVTINGSCSEFSCTLGILDNNLISAGCGGFANKTYYEDINPLYQSETNLVYLLGFLIRDSDFPAHLFYPLVSKSNQAWQSYLSKDPESSLYEYRRSADGLPESTRIQWYYVGSYEGSCDNAEYLYY